MRKKLSRKRFKRQRRFIIIGLFVLLFCLSTIYAAFSSNISLNVKGNIMVTPESCFSVSDNGDGTGTITDYDKSCGTKVKIPDTINGLTITKLADLPIDASTTKGFANKGITKIQFPSTLTYIGNMEFFHNYLTSVDIPNGVTCIGSQAFSGNKITGELKLPSTIKVIKDVAFYGNQITKVNIPSSVTSLWPGAFTGNNISGNEKFIYGRNADGSINYSVLNSFASKEDYITDIPSTVEKISTWSFGGMRISYIEIPSNVKKIEGEAFSMTKLSSIKLNEGLLSIGNNCFSASTLKEITLPSTITNINTNAFYNSNLKIINIKASKDSIGGSPWGASLATVNWNQ